MQILDLTQPITPGMSVYPGDPVPKLEPAFTMERDGFRETLLALHSHAGTHVDAPAHLLPGGATLDTLPLHRFWGTAAVLHCAPGISSVTAADLEPIRVSAEQADFLLLDTGWSSLWNTAGYQDGWPVPDESLLRFLTGSGKLGVGIDALSIDRTGSTDFENHRRLLGANLLIFENLRALRCLPEGLFHFCAMPLLYENADGSPVRAAAILE